MKEKVIYIEICKSFYKDGTYNLRIGNIQGCTETNNCSRKDILKDISDEIEELAGGKE